MANYSFNLVDERWIPCLMLDGTASDLGLLETLTRAHEIREVFDPSPLITVALHRLLLAILHSNFGPGCVEEWKAIWDTGHFHKGVLEDYFQQWHNRFNLFDEEQPFYQVAEFGEVKVKLVPISDLLPETARGNNPSLFDHTFDDTCLPLQPGAAARGLVALYSFKLGGLSGLESNFVDAPSARNVLFLVLGDDLFQTLMLNFVHYDTDINEPISGLGQDCPIWEQDRPADSSIPKGYLDYLTWQTLSLRLRPDVEHAPQLRIKEIDMALGRNLKNDGIFFDPAVAYKKDKKTGWVGLRLREGKALWRDSTSLFFSVAEERLHPTTMRWIALLIQKGIVDRSAIYRVDAYGLCTTQAKIEFWRHERMPLPLDYLADDSLVGDLHSALLKCEAAGKALRSALWKFAATVLAPHEGKAEQDAVRDLVSHLGADTFFWPRLETPFYRLLSSLPKNRESTLDEWITTLRHTAWDAFNKVSQGLDQSARTLHALVKASQSLGAGLKHALG